MKLDMRLRRLVLPDGVVLTCRPLTLGAYQRWLAVLGKHREAGADVPAMMAMMADAQVTTVALDILRESLVKIEGLTVVSSESVERDGNLDDLVQTGGSAMHMLIRAATELFTSSGLSGADLGNSAAPPTVMPAAAPEPGRN